MYQSANSLTVAELCDDLTMDIENMKDKRFLLTALTSHIVGMKTNISEELIIIQISNWFNDLI